MKKFISIILILVLFISAVVPAYAVGESMIVSGLGTIATAMGFSSIAPVIGALAALTAAGVILTTTDVVPVVSSFFQSVFTPDLEDNLTAIGTSEVSPSSAVVTAVNDYINSLTLSGIPDGVTLNQVISNVSKQVDYNHDYLPGDYSFFVPTFHYTSIPGTVLTTFNYGSNYGKLRVILFFINLFSNTVYAVRQSFNYSDYSTLASLPYTVSISQLTNSTGNITFSIPITPTNGNETVEQSVYTNVLPILSTYTGHTLTKGNNSITFYPYPGFNTSLTTLNPNYSDVNLADVEALTEQTVISVPQSWTYDNDEDVLTIPDVGVLTPGVVVPSIPSGTGAISWEASPEWQDQSPDVPEWTFRIPILSSIVRFLAWLGSLIKALGNWLASIWNDITGFFDSVLQFFADFRTFVVDLFNLLRGSDLSAFVSAIFGFLSGYTLYNGLFSAYLPQCVAVVLWAAWLCIMAFWVLRLILNR